MNASVLGLGAASFGASSLLSACANMERKISGDGGNELSRIVILGAGLSGLVAARELRKVGVPFRMFEASGRVGGRIYSLPDFNAASQAADLGAEWISDQDDFVLSLCRELRIELVDVPVVQKATHIIGSTKASEIASWQKELRLLEQSLQNLRESKSENVLDQMSVADVFASVEKAYSAKITRWLSSLALSNFGDDLYKISALHYFDRFAHNPTMLRRLQSQHLRIAGGLSVLTQALYDKVAGIVPDAFIQRNHELVEIVQQKNHLQMTFKTPNGNVESVADVVICTLPWGCLRKVKGIDNIGFSSNKLQAIRELNYGKHSKVASSYTERFWPPSLATAMDESGTMLWDSTPQRFSYLPLQRGILSAQFSGEKGANGGPELADEVQKLLEREVPGKVAAPEFFQVMNWQSNPWSQGSIAYFSPGQATAFTAAMTSSERNGRFIFAGEHASQNNMGTLNGAVESGLRAALEAAHFKSDLQKRGLSPVI